MNEEQLNKLARAINERRGHSVKQTDGWFELMLSGKNAVYFSNTGGDNAWLNAPRVCTDREAAMDALEEWRLVDPKLRQWALWAPSCDESVFTLDCYDSSQRRFTETATNPSLPLAVSLCLAKRMGIDVEEVMA